MGGPEKLKILFVWPNQNVNDAVPTSKHATFFVNKMQPSASIKIISGSTVAYSGIQSTCSYYCNDVQLSMYMYSVVWLC